MKEVRTMGSKQTSRTDVLAADQAMVDGIAKNKAKLPPSFEMEGQTMTPDAVSQVFQDRIATGKAVVDADNARTKAVKADRDKRQQTSGVALSFKRLLIALFAQDPAILGDFAVEPPKQGQRTAANKADAAAKGLETRKTLGTKGTRQKKAALQAAAAASATPAAPTPAGQVQAAPPAAPASAGLAPAAPAPAAAPANKPVS
jgi:hypothetical protein